MRQQRIYQYLRPLHWLYGLLCLAFVLILLPAVHAQGPVDWKASTERTGAGTYTLQITGTIKAGWHVYAAPDSSLGLQGIVVHPEHEGVQAGMPQALQETSVLPDPLFEGKPVQVYEQEFAFQQEFTISEPIPAALSLTVNAFASNGKAFLPLQEKLVVRLEGGVEPAMPPAASIRLAAVDLKNPVAACGQPQEAGGNTGILFFLGFLGGLLALLTPCVFPMIPLTVTFFTSRSTARKQAVRHGLLFGLFIFLIYLACSLPFHLLDSMDPGILNSLSTNVWVNLFFFAVFVLFALSFFGLFELTLPGSFTNKVDARGSLASLGGVFFLALTLALVSFSCTGPILGTLLVGSLSSESGAWQLTAGMGGFGLALALPFAAFAMFPGWLQLMPRSGGWLGTVKKSLAFVELALAVKFLSNADLVAQWGLLKREVFIGIWVLLAIALALYLFGILRFPDEPKFKPIGRGRKLVGALVLIFALYMAPGLGSTAQPELQLLSGFPPPQGYSIYEQQATVHFTGDGGGGARKRLEPQVVNDFDAAVQLAKAQGKPLLLDFTGWACVNCRKMEEQVWSEPGIAALIGNEFVLVSLYVDDRQQLPAAERFTFTGTGGYTKEIQTIGDKWATFQAVNFGQVTQPLYVILSPEQELINLPIGYTPDEAAYASWLQCGLDAYNSSH